MSPLVGRNAARRPATYRKEVMQTASERIGAARDKRRREKYRQVFERFGGELDAPYSGAEDAAEIIEGREPCGQFVAVTESNEGYVYAYARETLDAAKAQADEYIDDSTYAEHPVRIVDLDSGQEWWPHIRVSWDTGGAPHNA